MSRARMKPGQLPRSPFSLVDEVGSYYDTPAEPNNVHVEVMLPGLADYRALRQAADEVIAAVPRARGRMAAGRPLRRRYTWEFPPVPDVDPLSRATWSGEDELAAVRARFLSQAPPLRTSPPVRLLLATGPAASCVMLNAHHSALDGLSCLTLLRDIAARYHALTGEQEPLPVPVPLPITAPLPVAPSRAPARPARPWPSVPSLHGYPAARIAAERERRQPRDGQGVQVLLVPPVPRPRGATVNDVLVAALIATVSRWNAAHHKAPRLVRIAVPVNARGPQGAEAVGNHSRIVTVIADPRAAGGDLSALLAAVTRQLDATRHAGPRPASGGVFALAPGWLPVELKRLATQFALHVIGRLVCDTCLLSNLGNVTDPPWSGSRGRVRMAFTPAVHMPPGLSIGVVTSDAQTQLGFRYRYALLDDAAAAMFAAMFAATLGEFEFAADVVPARARAH